jgi:ubiquinone/menaquinone biosynthesis C-methylase UbiE
MRKERFSDFINLVDVSEQDKIIDIGGAKKIWLGTGLEKNVTIVNITVNKKSVDEHGITYIQGDACNLEQFDDHQFDVAFSNSVIEHVGNFEMQRKFSKELRRLAPRYWVQTPYKHFPIEPHFLFPFFQYLPPSFKKMVGTRWKYSHYKRWDQSDQHIYKEIQNTRLLNISEMELLFEHGMIYKETFLGMLKSVVMYKN